MDKQELLDTIQREAELWERFLAEVGEERMEQPGVSGEWTFKDVVAHLSAWRARTLERLDAARRDQAPSFSFWPAGLEEESVDDLQKINAWIYEENRERLLHDVLTESRQQFRRMSELVRSLPQSVLSDPNRFEWMEGRPISDIAHFSHFHEEHEPELRAWMASTQS